MWWRINNREALESAQAPDRGGSIVVFTSFPRSNCLSTQIPPPNFLATRHISTSNPAQFSQRSERSVRRWLLPLNKIKIYWSLSIQRRGLLLLSFPLVICSDSSWCSRAVSELQQLPPPASIIRLLAFSLWRAVLFPTFFSRAVKSVGNMTYWLDSF